MAQITKDMLISEIISIDTGIIPILMEAGMHCAGCPSAQTETLEQACFSHSYDVDKLVNDINEYLNTL